MARAARKPKKQHLMRDTQTNVSFWNAKSTKQAAARGATLFGTVSVARSLGGQSKRGYKRSRAAGIGRGPSIVGTTVGTGIRTGIAAGAGAGIGAGFHKARTLKAQKVVNAGQQGHHYKRRKR